MLPPDRALLAGLLQRCRAWEHLVTAEPKDLVSGVGWRISRTPCAS